MLDGGPVYKDCNGHLCIETSDFLHLRGFTPDEKEKLSKVLERVKEANLVEKKEG